MNPYQSPCESRPVPYDFTILKKCLLAVGITAVVMAACLCGIEFIHFDSSTRTQYMSTSEIVRSFLTDWSRENPRTTAPRL